MISHDLYFSKIGAVPFACIGCVFVPDVASEATVRLPLHVMGAVGVNLIVTVWEERA